jgi:tryptophan 2-C-methyltransferase
MSCKRVLLINPNRMQPPIAPIGLEYVAAGLERYGYTPILCDLSFAEDWGASLDAAASDGPYAAALVSIRNLDDAYFASRDFILGRTNEIIQRLRGQGRPPVILGGVGFSIAPAEVLGFTGADYGIAGDGEDALPALLDCLAAGERPVKVPGAVYRESDGAIRAHPPAMARLDTPLSSRRYLDHARYFAEGGQAGLETKRGCGHGCIYCVEPQAKGCQVRLHAPELVVEEIRDLLDQGVNVFHLCDSEFNLPPAHAHAVCAAIESAGLGKEIRWYTYAYPHPFDEPLARAMARAGCTGVNLGVDHGDPGMIRRLGRQYTPGDLEVTVNACRRAGLTVMFDMLFGAPGETRESLAAAIELMRTLDVDRVGLSCGVRVYPHTPLARQVMEQGSMAQNPNLHGVTEDNDHFLRPVFYVEAGLDGDIHDLVSELVRDDKRFLHTNPNRIEGNYNYNNHAVLAQAIRNGERGAYWDILRRLDERARRM